MTPRRCDGAVATVRPSKLAVQACSALHGAHSQAEDGGGARMGRGWQLRGLLPGCAWGRKAHHIRFVHPAGEMVRDGAAGDIAGMEDDVESVLGKDGCEEG